LSDTRVVLLNGARQTGKSTLAKQLAAACSGHYLTLDDPAPQGHWLALIRLLLWGHQARLR